MDWRETERPVRVVQMPACRVAEGGFEQGLIVPDANAVHARERGCQFAQARVEHQFAHPRMRVGQFQALREHLRVIGVRVVLIVQAVQEIFAPFLRQSLIYRLLRVVPPAGELVRIQKVGYNEKALFLIGGYLIGRQSVTHRPVSFRGFLFDFVAATLPLPFAKSYEQSF